MTTPRKNFNYNSPYAKPVQQYPSQSQDYISLDMGGPRQLNNAGNSSSEKTPGCYYGKYYQQNYRNSNSKANRRNLFNNSYGHQQQQHQRHSPKYCNNERPQNTKHDYQKNKLDKSISSYCHPSMTEDPWSELMQRIHALEKSKICVKESLSPKQSTLPPASNSASDNDEVDSEAGD